MPDYKKFFVRSFKDFFYSCFISFLISILLPHSWLYIVFFSLSYGIRQIKFSFYSILFANFCSGLILFFLGMKNDRVITFFLMLNGVLLGIVLAFLKNISTIWGLLAPHSLFETPAIIGLAASIRFYAAGIEAQYQKIYVQTIILFVGLVIPLFIISAFLEARSHYGF